MDLQSTKGAPRRPSPGRAGLDRLHRYTDGRRAHKKLSLNAFHHRRIKHDKTRVDGKVHINGVENFRGDAQRRLKADHAGFKFDFRRFIRERSFRFNHRDDENALDYPQDALLNWSAQVT
ncbi:MAG: hypothetical protein GF399_09510 [Candidatus Coatesbacteria bacterium]|nr:hypothetical protein [Candidatus Coatesbacteria bacterium]